MKVVKELNRIGFFAAGDPNWHCHAAITSLPFIVAVKYKIPLIFWGEHALDINGKNLVSEKIEFTKEKEEKDLRGFRVEDFIKKSKFLKKRDVQWLFFPSDEEINNLGVRGIYIGNYVKWNGLSNYKLAKKFGFKTPKKKFQRTYRQYSNIDDRYENGLHDYKFIKFGYGEQQIMPQEI